MLLLMHCGVFFMQNEIYAFFQKLIFLKKGQVIHNNTLLPFSLIIFIFIIIIITHRRRF